MWRATLKGLVAHRVRLALTAVAVVLGVGFVAGTYMLTDTMNRAFDDLFQQINRGVAVDVRGVHQFTSNGPGGQNAGAPARVPVTLLPTIAAIPGVRDVQGSIGGYAQLVDKQGKAISTGGAPTFGFNWIPDPELNAVSLSQGRAPQGAGEIAIDAATAMKYGFKIGDTAKVLLQGPPIQAEIVGIVKFGSSTNLLGATLVVFDPSIAQTALDGRGTFDDVLVAAANGVDPNELKNEVQKVLPAGYEALTGQESAQASSADIKRGLGFLNIALLVFAGISIFVGAFTIFNTFSILVAQRTRELALLRALGASASQVRRSVLAEAAVVGVFASAVGLAFGFVIAVGLQGLLGVFGIQLPSTTTQVLPRTIIVAFAVGIVTTVVASIGPALRASRVPPIAAIREAEPAAYRRSLRRTISGALVTLSGVGALLAALFGNVGGAKLVGLGAALVFLGVAILSPLMAGPLARIIGAPLPSISGVAGKLGRENAMRNPKRTASTAAALMIGLGLISFVSIFAASIKASAFQALEQTLKADYIVSTSSFSMGFSQDVAARLRTDPSFRCSREASPLCATATSWCSSRRPSPMAGSSATWCPSSSPARGHRSFASLGSTRTTGCSTTTWSHSAPTRRTTPSSSTRSCWSRLPPA